MSGTIRVVPVPEPATTVSRFCWVWVQNKEPQLGYPYESEEEARRVGHPPKKAALLELVLPRDEVLAAIQGDTWGTSTA